MCSERNVEIPVGGESVGIRVDIDVKFPSDQIVASELKRTMFCLFVQTVGCVYFIRFSEVEFRAYGKLYRP